MSEVPTNKFPDPWGRLGEIPPYAPERLIGRGTFGEVYHWNKDGIQMAVKRIRVINSCVTDIEREMNIVSQLTHNHIIQCYGVDHDTEHVFIITDYAEGGNLHDAALRLDWEDKKRIVGEVALGLAYLHSQGIIHRDIKGGNILLTKHDEAKLCDFGIAKVISSAISASSHVPKGTRGFMAPELIRSKPAYSTMSDVFALGAVMHELIRGDKTPPDYMAIMNRCLNEDPEKRPTVEEIVGAFHVVHQVHNTDSKGDQVEEEQGLSADEEFILGRKLFFGSGGEVDVNHAEGAEMLLRSASKGHTKAQFLLGHAYYFGVGVLRDFTKGVKWLQMAADKGFAPAQFTLGKVYLNGSVPQDYGKALDLLQAAANRGYIEANTFLGLMYLGGNHVPQNNEEAMQWFLKAAAKGCVVALERIGIMLYHGSGIEKDYAESREFLLMAASRGRLEACFCLGEMYRYGRGVPQDDCEAYKWWLKAAEGGDMMAQYNVGFQYIHGKGVPKNASRGRGWLKKAAEQGSEDAQHLLEVVTQALLN